MKVLIVLALATFAYAYAPEGNTAYGYIKKYAIPLGEEIRKAEEKIMQERIVGGHPSSVGQFPYQAGLLASYAGIVGTGVCGGSLVTANRVITAAHCWYDGVNQAWLVTVVLGSNHLFIDGGVRQNTSAVTLHPNWFPLLALNDVAVIYLPERVEFSDTISPIALPSGSQLEETFVGATGVASGFGLTVDGGSVSGALNHVSLTVISNSVCRFAFPINLQPSNLCTSGTGGASVCRGDSGGPLAITRDGKTVLIGITSYGSPLGCQASMPQAFARVTSFMSFFNQHISS